MEAPSAGARKVLLNEDERKMMQHFIGTESAESWLQNSAVGSQMTSKLEVGPDIMNDSTRLGPPIDVCMRAVYGKDWGSEKCSEPDLNKLYNLKPILPCSPNEFWKGQITFTDVDPSPEAPGSRFIHVKMDGRIPCLEFSATMLSTSRFVLVLQAPSRLQTIDSNENMSVGEVTMCLSMGGVIKGCNKPALNQYDRELLKCMSKEPTCPSSGIMAFYSIIVNEVYNRRELYFGPKSKNEDLVTFSRRFANNVDLVTSDLPGTDPSISYIRVSVSDTVAPHVISGDAFDPRSSQEVPRGHIPVDASFDDMRMCGSAIMPVINAPTGIWICGGRFGVKWMLSHVMVLPNMYDPTLRTLLQSTNLSEPMPEGEEQAECAEVNRGFYSTEENLKHTQMITNALQRWCFRADVPLISCPTGTTLSMHLTRESVAKIRAGRLRKEMLAKRDKDMNADHHRSVHRAKLRMAAKKQRDDNEYLRAKHEAIDLVGRVFRKVEEQERVRREARLARAQIRLAKRVRAQQFARRARLELAKALHLRRTEALRGLNAAAAERALARPAERGELEARAHHARRRSPPAPAVAAVDVNAHRQRQRRKIERRAARRAEKERAASKPSIEVVKRSSRVFWATPAPVYTTPPESWDEARLNREWGFPVVDFAQWEVDFEADLACVREDALRFARFKEAQPLLRLDELRRIQARWAEERAAQPPPSRKAAKRARKAANVRAWRDGVRTDTEQLLQAKYTGINRAYGEATTRYKAAVEKLTAEKEAARAEAAATQKSSYNAQECVVCMDAPRTEVALPCKHFCVCAECAARIERKCPICNGAVTAWLGVRMA